MLPFRLGEFVRVFLIAKLENLPLSESAGICFVDRVTDIWILFIFGLVFYCTGYTDSLTNITILFSVSMFFVFIAILFLKFFQIRNLIIDGLDISQRAARKGLYFVVYWIAARFWISVISLRFISITLAMWCFYFAGLHIALGQINPELGFVFNTLVAPDLLKQSDLRRYQSAEFSSVIFFAYVFASAIFTLLFVLRGRAFDRLKLKVQQTKSNLLDRSVNIFSLEKLFVERSDFTDFVLLRDVDLLALPKRLINSNERLISAHRGGSGAIIVTIESEQSHLKIRKYAEKEPIASRLIEQANYTHRLKNIGLPISVADDVKKSTNHVKYDMGYIQNSRPFPELALKANALSNEKLKKICLESFDTLFDLASKSTPSAKQGDVEWYLNEKMLKNIKTALRRAGGNFKQKIKLPNGVFALDLMFDVGWARSQLVSPSRSEVHGDATLENLIVAPDLKSFYWIDPNPSNYYSNMLQDFGKVLQSLHYGYDFHHMIDFESDFDVNSVVALRPKLYADLEVLLCEKLIEFGGRQAVCEAYFHEIVHYCRLVNYKFNTSTATGLFYLRVIEELVSEYCKNRMHLEK